MTRGRTANHAYVATDSPDVDHDGAPAPPADGAHVLRAILANSGAELSATESIDRNGAASKWKSRRRWLAGHMTCDMRPSRSG